METRRWRNSSTADSSSGRPRINSAATLEKISAAWSSKRALPAGGVRLTAQSQQHCLSRQHCADSNSEPRRGLVRLERDRPVRGLAQNPAAVTTIFSGRGHVAPIQGRFQAMARRNTRMRLNFAAGVAADSNSRLRFMFRNGQQLGNCPRPGCRTAFLSRANVRRPPRASRAKRCVPNPFGFGHR